MKTFSDVKRRLAPGVRLLCVENTKRPEVNGSTRIVQTILTNAFTWRPPDDPAPFWTYFPPARRVQILDRHTFRMPITGPYREDDSFHTITLRFVEDDVDERNDTVHSRDGTPDSKDSRL